VNLVIDGNYSSLAVDDNMGVSHFATVRLQHKLCDNVGALNAVVPGSMKTADITTSRCQKQPSSNIPDLSNKKILEGQPHLHQT
jgi:hypothetical protein